MSATPATGDRSILQSGRVISFSDAVMAIAITLLALEIRLPEGTSAAQLGPALLALWPRYLGFVISFAVIGTYWMAHHNMFQYIERFDGTLMRLNFLFLGWIVFMPFATGVVGEHGNTPLGQIFYAGTVTLTGLARILMWRYASHKQRLLEPGLDPRSYRHVTIRGLIGPIVFLISIPFTFINFVVPIVLWSIAPVLSALVRPRPQVRA